MKRLGVLFLVLGVLAVVPGCMETCYEPGKPYFDIRGLVVNNIIRSELTWNIAYSDFQFVDSLQPVTATKFGISLEALQTFYASFERQQSSFGFLLACGPAPSGTSGSKEFISEINVISDASFDSLHPAGTNLNEFFRVSAVNNNGVPRDSLNNVAIPLTTLLANGSMARRFWQLWLTQRPETALSHRFTVVYKQINGEEYIVTAPLVTFY